MYNSSVWLYPNPTSGLGHPSVIPGVGLPFMQYCTIIRLDVHFTPSTTYAYNIQDVTRKMTRTMQNSPSPGISKIWFNFVVLSIILPTEDTMNFIRISILLNKTVNCWYSWTKFFISPVILKTTKKADPSLEIPRQEFLW